ncbi:MAG: ATP-binding protein, partial [Delftia sp.]|nr:ATP-binding protein [Delftia sp.]
LTLATLGVVALSLRHYLAYAGNWAAAQEYPLQQIIPLLAPPRESIDGEGLRPSLWAIQAFSTDEQVHDALETLVKRGLMQREGDAYRFVSPWMAWVHRWVQGRRRIPALAERIRTGHPLYARTRGFFDQAHFRIQELSAEEFMLRPQGQEHPQARYGPMYARLIAGRPTTGDDFTAVRQAAGEHYGSDDLAHRVAVVISDQRPEPGARYRLYEIRQKEGLAIVPLDSALFGQIKPNRTASDILAAEIDQATGQQNLYAISGPVSGDLSFFGRESLLQDVIDLLDAGQPVGLFGLRKVGKTSLIQRLQGRLAERRPIAFVDTQGTTRQQGVRPFYPAIVAAFVEHLQRYRPDFALPKLRLYPQAEESSLATADAFMQDLEALHEALGQPDKKERLLLIVDEVDRLLPFGDTPGYEGLTGFFGQLRAANQQARLLDMMLVGVDPAFNRRERWGDHDNELYRALREVWMPPMAHKDVRDMVKSLGLQMGVRYGRQALARLARAGGGHPFVTRQMCSRAVEDRLGKGTIKVTVPQAEAAIEDFIFQDAYLPEMW